MSICYGYLNRYGDNYAHFAADYAAKGYAYAPYAYDSAAYGLGDLDYAHILDYACLRECI